MNSFIPVGQTYRVNYKIFVNRPVFEVRFEEVSPVLRNPGVGIFNANEKYSAKERVVNILREFFSGSEIPPVEVVLQPIDSEFRFKLVHGVHRFYCSLAAGFSHIPAVKGFDINS